MTIQQHASFDSSAAELNATSKLVKAWESKNAKNAARAGGVSLMALSLAACGGSDDVEVDITSDNATVTAAALTTEAGTSYATVDAAVAAGSNTSNGDAVTAALTDANGVAHNNVDVAITSNDAAIETAATNAAEATLVAGTGFASVAALKAAYDAATAPTGAVSESYTTGTDLLTALTSADDTVTGVFGTVATADVLVDVYSTDNDTANLTVADASNVTISGIETLNIDVRDTNATSTVVLDKVSGANNITLTSSYGSTSMTADKVADGQKITFNDTDFTTIGVNAGGTVDGASNDAHLVLTGAMTSNLTTQASNFDIDGLIIETSGGASTITLAATDDFIASTTGTLDDEYITARGTENLTIVVNQAAGNGLDGAILNNEMSGAATVAVKIDGGTLENGQIDLSSLAADKIVIADATSGTSGDLKVASGAVLESGVANVFVHTTAITSATVGGSVTYNVKHADATDVDLTFTSFGTVNIVMAGTAALSWTDDIKTTYSGIGNSTDLNITTGAAALTMGDIAATAANTLDAVTVSGAGVLVTEAIAANSVAITSGDFSSSTIAANSLTANVEDFVATDLTIEGAVAITASKTVTVDGIDNTAANTATLTINAGDDVTFSDGIGRDNAATVDLGAVSITSTAGSISIEQLDSDAGVTLSAAGTGEGVTASAGLTAVGNVSVTAGGTANLAAVTASGTLDVSAKLVDLNGATAGSTITLTATDTVNNSTFDDDLTGDVVFNGDGVTYASVTNNETITGNVTVQGGASLSMTAGTEILTGAVTHTGSGTVSIQDLAGTYSGATATGIVDIDDTAAGATSIITGNANDNIITGDVASQITTNGGNDVIDASLVGAAKQVIINAGDGIDTITGGISTTDILTGGAGTDTFVWATDVNGSINETITDFTVGSAGDVLSFALTTINAGGATFSNTALGAIKTIDTSDAGATTLTIDDDFLIFTGEGYASNAAFATAAGGASGVVLKTNGDDMIAVWYNTTTGKAVVSNVVESTGDKAIDSASDIVSLDNVSLADLADLTVDNFLIA